MIVVRRKFLELQNIARLSGDEYLLTVATQYSGFPSSRLFVDNLDDYLMMYGQNSSQTWIQAQSVNTRVAYFLQFIGLLGINRNISGLIPDASITDNRWRLRADSFPLSDRIRPAINALSKTNLTGSISDISGFVEPPVITPPGYVQTMLLVTNPAVNTQAIVTFDDHTTAERDLSSTEAQKFRVYVQDSSSVETWPTIQVKLRHNGVDGSTLIADSARKTAEGFIIDYLVEPGDMPSFVGAFGLKIDGTSTGTSAPQIIKVEWVAELETAGDSAILLDTDWINLIYDKDLIHLFAGDGFLIPKDEARYFHFELSNLGRQQFVIPSPGGSVPVYTISEVIDPFHAGRFVASETITVPMEGDSSYIPRKVQGPNNVSRVYQGGLRSPRNAATWWEADVVVCAQKQSRIFGELEDQFNALGLMTLCTLFIPDPEDLSTAIWACLSAWEAPHKGMFSGTDDDGLPYSNQHMYELNFSIVEKTGRRTTGG